MMEGAWCGLPHISATICGGRFLALEVEVLPGPQQPSAPRGNSHGGYAS